MKIKDVARAIRKHHDFFITADYWPRIGMICSRYTAESAGEAVESLSKEKYDSLDHLLNGVEIYCQNKSAKSTDDDFFDGITKEIENE